MSVLTLEDFREEKSTEPVRFRRSSPLTSALGLRPSAFSHGSRYRSTRAPCSVRAEADATKVWPRPRHEQALCSVSRMPTLQARG